MSESDRLRDRITELTKKRSQHESRLASARSAQAKKSGDASSYRMKAANTKSESMRKSYQHQEDSAEKAAITEGKKVAAESKNIADCSKKEAELTKQLGQALSRESTKERRDRERSDASSKREQERREADAKRQHEAALQTERARYEALVRSTERRLNTEISNLRPPKVEKLRVLYLTAATKGDLRVDQEVRRVKASVRAATHRDLIEVEHLPAATAEDLLDGLVRYRPHVVHFSGHGNKTHLVFDSGADAKNEGVRVTASALSRAISAVDHAPTLVVLNACQSEAHLEILLDACPIAIGMSESVGDGDAIAYATRFYTSLADGVSVSSAHEIAKAQLALLGLPGADFPVLRERAGEVQASAPLVVPPEA